MTAPLFLIVDYNLSRIDEVRHLSDHARERHGARVILIRAAPTAADRALADEVIDLDPLRDDFAEMGLKLLDGRREHIAAGVVFSDNAVRSGAELLARLGVTVDAPHLADGAFSKFRYRLGEAHVAPLLAAQRIMVPAFAEIASLGQLRAFAQQHPGGFVVKPSAEGNNRGVVVVRPGDDLTDAFAEVLPYLEGGVICEELIPYRREYSFDGIGPLSFLTEKISAPGRYPVEIAQVLPAVLGEHERATLERAGRWANALVGQCDGPFHNEIKLSEDGLRAAVVEPNRRPGGMKIWSLARWVYGIDLHHHWVDTAFATGTTTGTSTSTAADADSTATRTPAGNTADATDGNTAGAASGTAADTTDSTSAKAPPGALADATSRTTASPAAGTTDGADGTVGAAADAPPGITAGTAPGTAVGTAVGTAAATTDGTGLDAPSSTSADAAPRTTADGTAAGTTDGTGLDAPPGITAGTTSTAAGTADGTAADAPPRATTGTAPGTTARATTGTTTGITSRITAGAGTAAGAGRLVAGCSAATVLLGVSSDRSFTPDDITPGAQPFAEAVRATAAQLSLTAKELEVTAFSWLSPDRRDLHAVARDNADFAAQGCVVLHARHTDIRTVVHTLRTAWLHALDRALAPAVRKAS